MSIILILVVSSILASLGQVLFKLSGGNFRSFYLYLGFILYGVSALLWVYSLKFLPLSKVYPFTFLTFAFVLLFSYFLFDDKLSFINIIGIFFIILGVFLCFL